MNKFVYDNDLDFINAKYTLFCFLSFITMRKILRLEEKKRQLKQRIEEAKNIN
ncbi:MULTISPECIES: hypothetical protein [Paenibacillus]|uniref:hypothetical protein n=1 Tax=Paenibacillus TaxID=44249 RepID=UPI0004B88731|nr:MULTISPECIES: hypothetical protein [Paenibacillus]